MIKKIDHVVITTQNMETCVAFYEALGFLSVQNGGRYELFSGDFKINVHFKGRELAPKAQNVKPGSGDFCFEIEGDLVEMRESLLAKGICPELDIVDRHGARGVMRSLYLRDPDGNLIELCTYE